jgi:hypothetical protein
MTVVPELPYNMLCPEQPWPASHSLRQAWPAFQSLRQGPEQLYSAFLQGSPGPLSAKVRSSPVGKRTDLRSGTSGRKKYDNTRDGSILLRASTKQRSFHHFFPSTRNIYDSGKDAEG